MVVRIVSERIDTGSIARDLRAPGDGACVTFEGVVRDHARGRRVRYLVYEAYEEMARAGLEEIRLRALERYDVRQIAVVHRIGRLEIGETSVAVLVLAAHRAPAFEACRYVIDSLKAEVPVFKHEYYEDGERWIEGPG